MPPIGFPFSSSNHFCHGQLVFLEQILFLRVTLKGFCPDILCHSDRESIAKQSWPGQPRFLPSPVPEDPRAREQRGPGRTERVHWDIHPVSFPVGHIRTPPGTRDAQAQSSAASLEAFWREYARCHLAQPSDACRLEWSRRALRPATRRRLPAPCRRVGMLERVRTG
jgi:hypothetical protein